MRIHQKADKDPKNHIMGFVALFSLYLLFTTTGCQQGEKPQDEMIKTEILEDSTTKETAKKDTSAVLKDTLTTIDAAAKAKPLDEDKVNRLKGKLNLNVEEVKKKMEFKRNIKENRE